MVLSPFLLNTDPDRYRFCLDPDPYQSTPWIRLRNEFFHILDPDPYQNDTDPPHCRSLFYMIDWTYDKPFLWWGPRHPVGSWVWRGCGWTGTRQSQRAPPSGHLCIIFSLNCNDLILVFCSCQLLIETGILQITVVDDSGRPGGQSPGQRQIR